MRSFVRVISCAHYYYTVRGGNVTAECVGGDEILLHSVVGSTISTGGAVLCFVHAHSATQGVGCKISPYCLLLADRRFTNYLHTKKNRRLIFVDPNKNEPAGSFPHEPGSAKPAH